jgi:hypothetical protein
LFCSYIPDLGRKESSFQLPSRHLHNGRLDTCHVADKLEIPAAHPVNIQESNPIENTRRNWGGAGEQMVA